VLLELRSQVSAQFPWVEKTPVEQTKFLAGSFGHKPKNTAALHIALGGLPDKMRVEVERNIGVSANTVGELRKVTAWPENLVIITPEESHPDSTVKVSKASVATRVSPKP
jgi:hypothetical protein